VTFACSPKTGNFVVVMGSLHPDEVEKLLPADAERTRETAAEFVLAFFQRHGPGKTFDLLVRSPCTAGIYEQRSRRLLAIRDAIGYWPLYWALRPDGVVHLATRLLSLVHFSHVSLNEQWLGQLLLMPFAFSELANAEQTVFRTIHRILPGQALEISAGKITRRFAWKWQFPSHPDRLTDDAFEACAGRLRELLENAVRRCLGNAKHAAVELSGGLDSSAVACLARRIDPGRQLTLLSLVHRAFNLTAERQYIDAVVGQLADGAGVQACAVDGDELLSFQWFDREIPEHDEPSPGLVNVSNELCRMECCGDALVLLTGLGAEISLEPSLVYLADLLRRGRVRRVLAEARQWAYGRSIPLWTVLGQWVLRPCLPSWLRDGLGPLFRGGYSKAFPQTGLFSVPPWVRKSFAVRTDLWRAGLRLSESIFRYPSEQSFLRFCLQTITGGWSAVYLAGPSGRRVLHPFLDVDLVNYCLQLPVHFKETPGVQTKRILRAALGGILPENVRTRRGKRGFDLQVLLGLLQNQRQLELMIAGSQATEALDVLDRQTLIAALRTYTRGLGDAVQGGRLANALVLIAWLDHWQSWANRKLSPALTWSAPSGRR
jgi:asparagine synthase (glutamine-hydrolysing)